MDDPQQQNHAAPRPWHLKGVKGTTLVHPDARVLSIATEILYDVGAEPKQKIGMGVAVTFEIPSRNEGNDTTLQTFLTLNTTDEILVQITDRGGWR